MGLQVKLVRHGESLANVGEVRTHEVGDHQVALSARGREQARTVGGHIGAEFLRGSVIYSSPYLRTRETLAGIVDGAGLTAAEPALRIYEDPRLREVEHGYEPIEAQEALRKTHGWFYYRFRGGESPADCYDRTSNFLESMMRQVERKQLDRVLVVTHGLTIRCFLMRFLHLTVEQFDEMANPHNCDVITIGERAAVADPVFANGVWAVTGIRLRAPTD